MQNLPPTKQNRSRIKVSAWKKKTHDFLLKIEGRLSSLRKKYLVINPEIRFWIAHPLKQATLFAGKLFSDDSFYFSARYAWVSPEDAKKLLLYGYARQVMKAGVSLIEDEEHTLEAPKAKDVDSFGRTVVEALIDSQKAILRKHIEVLVNLINFSTFDKGESYRMFLNAENLEHFLARQSDFKTFYESESRNIDSSKKTFSERISADFKNLGLKKIWFLREDWAKLNEPPIFTSIRKRYKSALLNATDDEKIVLGTTYNDSFGDFSAAVHGSAGSPTRERSHSFSALRRNISYISLLSQHIISRLNQLMGFDNPEDLIKKMAEGKTSDAPKLMARFKQPFHAGDLVLAMGDLCEVMECRQSVYGYTSCRVKFLTRAPLPDTPDDWLPCAFATSILPKSKVRSFIFNHENYANLPKEVKEVLEVMKKESDDEIAKYSTGALVDLHKHGVLIPMLIKTGYLKQMDVEEDE